jgi:autotransporter-associated beta strand protein
LNFHRFLTVFFTLSSLSVSSLAQTWTGLGATDDWDFESGGLFLNWSGGVLPDAGSDVTLGVAAGSVQALLSGDWAVNSLTFNSGGNFLLGAATGALTISDGAVIRTAGSTGIQTISVPLTLPTTAAWDINGAGSLVVSGDITAYTTLTKTGTGTLTLSGNNSDLAGKLAVESGTVILTNTAALNDNTNVSLSAGGSASSLIVNTPNTVEIGSLDLYAGGSIQGTGKIDPIDHLRVHGGTWNVGSDQVIRGASFTPVFVDGGTLNLTGSGEGIDDVVIAAGQVHLLNGQALDEPDITIGTSIAGAGPALFAAHGAAIDGDRVTLYANGTFDSGGGTLVAERNLHVISGTWTAGSTAASGLRLGGPNGGVDMNGGQLTLEGTNTYGSATFVPKGTLVVANAGALPSTTNLTLGSINGAPGSAVLALGAQSVAIKGLFIYDSATVTYTGAPTGRIEVTGVLTLGDGVHSFDNTGLYHLADTGELHAAGDLTLTTPLTHHGATWVLGAGIARISSDAVLGAPDAALYLQGVSHLQLLAPWQTSRSVVLRDAGAATGGVNIDTNGFDATIDGFITQENAAGRLNKHGAGTLTLTAGNSYSGGTVVDGGTLLAMNNNAFGSGGVSARGAGTLAIGQGIVLGVPLSLETGGTLMGSGLIGSVTTQAGGTIAPGFGAGVLKIGTLDASAGATFRFELGAASDRLDVLTALIDTGTGNLLVDVVAGSSFVPGDYVLLNFTAGAGLDANDFVLRGTPSFFVGNLVVDAGSATLHVVQAPEPSTAVLLLCGLGLGAARRRRTSPL